MGIDTAQWMRSPTMTFYFVIAACIFIWIVVFYLLRLCGIYPVGALLIGLLVIQIFLSFYQDCLAVQNPDLDHWILSYYAALAVILIVYLLILSFGRDSWLAWGWSCLSG